MDDAPTRTARRDWLDAQGSEVPQEGAAESNGDGVARPDSEITDQSEAPAAALVERTRRARHGGLRSGTRRRTR